MLLLIVQLFFCVLEYHNSPIATEVHKVWNSHQ